MPKKLSDTAIVDELRESSLLFPPGQRRGDHAPPAESVVPHRKTYDGQGEAVGRPTREEPAAAQGDRTPPLARTAPRSGGPDTSLLRELEPEAAQGASGNGVLPAASRGVIERIQHSVRQVGSKPITGRLTAEEKQALDEFLFTVKQAGIVTGGNEVTRIALQLVIEDYRRRGKSSTISKILELLHPAS